MNELLKRHTVLEKILNDEEITIEDERILIEMLEWINYLIVKECLKMKNRELEN
ncbi:hypothetical protein ABGF48_00820 [Helcococcus bovis]|uniref:hypothetical protein n=1 Tax=Helcococcus bovis TaxID=3153252 RepID=UPI0038BAA494